jgi:hypothetical protein
MESRNGFEFSRFIDAIDKEFHSKKDMFIALQGNADMLAKEILEAFKPYAYELAGNIKLSIESKENLQTVDNQPPHLIVKPPTDREPGVISPEILTWSIAILASAWTQWIFTAKLFNPVNQEDKDKKEAAINIKLAQPYVLNSIKDAMKIGEEIGKCKQTPNVPLSEKRLIFILIVVLYG